MRKTLLLVASSVVIGCFHADADDGIDASDTSGDDLDAGNETLDRTEIADTNDTETATESTDTGGTDDGETFECSNGMEIPISEVCEGSADCEDNSDEVTGCGLRAFTCGNGIEIPADWVCNGLTTCSDGADEANCGHQCGWDPRGGYYDCGFEGADPQSNFPIECPQGLAEGDPCAATGLTGTGCCDADGNNWYCARGDVVFFNLCQ